MHKNIIFYFTGTGNSLWVARELAARITDGCEVVSMPGYDRTKLPSGYERIGFVYPVYSGRPPRYVETFIQGMDFSQNPDAYYFTAATFGGTQGNAFYTVDKLLKGKGLKLQAAFGIRMNGNFISAYNPWEISEEKQKKIDVAIDHAGTMIAAKNVSKIPTRQNLIFALMHKLIMPHYLKSDKEFNVSDSCVSCGICYRVCPVNNIEMVDGRPVFQGHCEQCMACIHACPQKALNYKHVTQKRHRYRNKNIRRSDLYYR